MERVAVNGIELAYRTWGEGDVTVLFIHGNLASKEWISLAAPHFPRGIRTIAIDWRGCGDSDKPTPLPDFANYAVAQHARDMLAALDALNVSFCHLAAHSAGGLISTRMLLEQPQRFGRVFSLSPVAPQSILFPPEKVAFFGEMKKSKPLTRQIMAATCMSLFEPDSFAKGPVRFVADVGARGALFDTIVEQTFAVSDGIWFGTPDTLTKEAQSGELKGRMKEIIHPHLVAWGMLDAVIREQDLQVMTEEMPDCRLVAVPGVSHSMNVEAPELYAGYFGAWFGGLAC